MKKLIYSFVIVLISSHFLFGQWISVNIGTTNKLSCVSISERNSNYVWAVGENTSGSPYLYKSTNSGVNWITVNTFPANFYIPRGVVFDNDTGLVCGYPGIIATTNGGLNWSYMYNSSSTDTSVFVNMDAGGTSMWAVGNVVYNTTFGPPVVIRCANWTSLSSVFKRLTLPSSWSTYRLSSLSVKDSNTCIISNCTSNPGKILKTTNGGLNWTEIYINLETWALINDDVNDDVIGVGQQSGFSTIMRSTDFGSNWSMVYSNPGSGALYSVGSPFQWLKDTMYAVGQNGTIVRTINSGTTWTKQNSGITAQLNSVTSGHKFDKFAVAVGENGTVLKTINGGVWVNNISTEIPDKYSLSQNYPNPFNPNTIIRFQIKDSRFTTLKVYDVLGKEVETRVNEKLSSGEYEVSFSGEQLPSGVYFYKLTAGDFTDVKKMVLIK